MPAELSFPPIIITGHNEIWEESLPMGVPVHFSAGTFFSDIGSSLPSPDAGIYFIKKGRVKLSGKDAKGEATTLLHFGEGMIFNEVPMLQHSNGYKIVCMEDTEAVFLPKRLVLGKIFKTNDKLRRNLLESMAYKSNCYLARLKTYGGSNALCLVSRALYSMYLYNRYEETVVPRLTQAELSEYLGLHRRTLQRALARLKEEGICGQYSHKHLDIFDHNQLLSLAEGKNTIPNVSGSPAHYRDAHA